MERNCIDVAVSEVWTDEMTRGFMHYIVSTTSPMPVPTSGFPGITWFQFVFLPLTQRLNYCILGHLRSPPLPIFR